MSIKSRFRGSTEHTLDDKGRLSFPSRFRDVLRQFDSDILMVTVWGNKALRAYPLPEWEILENKLLDQGHEVTSLMRLILANVTECTLDKQGRILLSPSLRSQSNINKDVVVNGMMRWVEIWDKEAWETEQRRAKEEFESNEGKLARIGIYG